MTRCIFRATDEAATETLGAALADILPDGSVVGLLGDLGVGKTRLVRAVAAACGVDPQDVTSPTFVLVQQYRGRRELVHADAYRLADLDEFLQLGPEEWFESPALTFIEWADRVAPSLPEDRVTLSIEILEQDVRQLTLLSAGPVSEQAVVAVANRLSLPLQE